MDSTVNTERTSGLREKAAWNISFHFIKEKKKSIGFR